ncbi:DUF1566 domain-containing protein [Bacteroides sp. 519]|uniref:Lcl C-terminal domain-containing protein n=1 Tax=Bacteroides sp. 519 TaxID=2302937 RepID=UPI0013D38797|nr:DUF1566 domain-containing protein [Bacteroides sp. 519]NDV56929.1 DUF1566 domain-containing protein [Bacteroides sp. 519]
MKKILITAILASLLLPAQLIAQKVYKDASNRVILELTVSAGMPAGAITNAAKYESFTPSATKLGADNSENGSINATVFQKLEVAPNDINTAKEIGIGGTLTMNWVTAFNACKNSDHDGGGWRLPTQRELMLMYIFRPALEDLTGVAFAAAYYWSATENAAANSWYVRFDGTYSGYTYYGAKSTATYRARCVREIQ